MKVTVEIPDETAALLGLTEESAASVLLEDAAVEAYRAGRIGTGQLREILSLSWQEKEELLLRHKVYQEYAPGEIERETQDVLEQFKRREAEKSQKTAA